MAQQPSLLTSAIFRAKVIALRGKRAANNARTPVSFLQKGQVTAASILELKSPLYSEQDPRERALELGKVQNLRCVTRELDGIIIPAGSTFSFWKQVGPTTKRKGYVVGRQIESGCLVPARGGGICQLTNSLYELAMKAGCEIVERHPHTRKVPGARSGAPDATVAWNHIDLRFKPRCDMRLRTFMTATELIVRFELTQAVGERRLLPLLKEAPGANSCATCGQVACHKHFEASSVEGKTAFVLDKATPELKKWLSTIPSPDLLVLSADARRIGRPAYNWGVKCAQTRSATLQVLFRSFKARKLAAEGPARRRAALESEAALAHSLSKHLPFDATDIVVSQSLLPHLWLDKSLGGRSFTVLMHGFPMKETQRLLDEAATRNPHEASLTDFRATASLVDAEWEALNHASRIVTAHPAVAALFPDKAVLLPWEMPSAKQSSSGDAIAFIGPAIARKGSTSVRDAARTLGVDVVLVGRDLEPAGFWDGVRLLPPRENWLDGVFCVVQPSVSEEQPRKLLEAVAAGVPVITTSSSGLPKCPEVHLVNSMEGRELILALQAVMGLTKREFG